MDLSRPALDVAPDLLGCLLTLDGITLRLTEVEAYEGTSDPASHAHRGPTPRAAVMFGPAGRLYVYRSMGLHHCMNIVCGADGTASAVLLRAAEVVAGRDLARARRGDVPDVRLASGPGNLGRVLGVSTADTGAPLATPGTAPTGADGAATAARAVLVDRAERPVIATGPRVGVSRAADRPWRFWIEADPTVSTYRRHARAVEE